MPKVVEDTFVKILVVMAQCQALTDQESIALEQAVHREVLQIGHLVPHGRHFFLVWFLRVYNMNRESICRFVEEFVYIVHKSQEHCNSVLCMGLCKNTS